MPESFALSSAMLCNCGGLRKAARRVTLLYDRHLARSGLTIGQFALLNEIARAPKHEPHTLKTLAHALVMDRTALSHTLKPLERDGLIHITRDPRDARAKLLHLTARGRERAAAARDCWAGAQARFAAAFGERQAGALRALLRQVIDADLGDLQM